MQSLLEVVLEKLLFSQAGFSATNAKDAIIEAKNLAQSFTPSGSITATTTPDAIAQLDNLKAPKSNAAFTDSITVPTPDWGDNDQSAINSEYLKKYFTPLVIVNRTTSQTFASNRYNTGFDVVLYNNISTDTDGIYNSTNGRITIPTGRGGVYLIFSGQAFTTTASAAASHRQRSYFCLNGNPLISLFDHIDILTAAGSVPAASTSAFLYLLNANDYIQIGNGSGSSASYTNAVFSAGCYFGLVRVW